MVARNALEQMHAETLELIGPDAREHAGTGAVRYRADAALSSAHVEVGGIRPTARTRRRARRRRPKSAGGRGRSKTRESCARVCNIGGLVQRYAIDGQHLVRAETVVARSASADRKRLFARERCAMASASASAIDALNRPLVDLGAVDDNRDSRRFEQLAARALFEPSTSGRGAIQSEVVVDRCSGLSDEFQPMLAIQIDNRCRGLLDRPARHVDRRPALFGEQPPRRREFLGHRDAVDIIGLRIGVERKQAVLADLDDALGRSERPTMSGRSGVPARTAAAHAARAACWRSCSLDWRDRCWSASSRCG